jgi:deoxyribodipyrimidine photo-lyase
MARTLLWFRNDLRLEDNPALHAALAYGGEVLPVYIFDPDQQRPGPKGIARMGPYRAQFLRECLQALDVQLRARGSALQVHEGRPIDVLRALAAEHQATSVYAQAHMAWEEQQQERAVSAVLPLHLTNGGTLLHPDDLPFELERLPKVFTSFRHKVEARWTVRPTLPTPEQVPTPAQWTERPLPSLSTAYAVPTLDPRGVMPMRGGPTAALERLSHFTGASRALGHYKETRNGMLMADESSKLSPWLSAGALSPRAIYEAVRTYEARHGANESTYWLIFELLWRDFFHFTAAKHGADLFKCGGIARATPRGVYDRRRFEAWCEGRTGHPFIDANMRELAATGWMSNRGRQNVASYLVHDLGLDWRLGAAWFEQLLVDYDPCSNWGNWQYLAGVGNDPREGRRFNPDLQAERYDPDGQYVRRWIVDEV